MLLVGLTGGIGSGKSTVAGMLADRGAVVLDADAFARSALDPGTPAHAKVAERFPGVVGPAGEIDRAALGRLVFADAGARRELESFVHPEVARLTRDAIALHADTDRVVVYVVPLLVETHMERAFDVVVTISADEDVRVQRVVAARAMSADEVAARIASQANDEDRGAVADVVLDNDGGPGDLEAQVARLWTALEARAGTSS
jgi:dephospho-CoA kinase